MDQVVIVGAGQGGFQTAASLREGGYGGRITLVGDEPGLPYGRPPLSKAYLAGKADADTIRLRPTAFFAERDIAVVTGRAEGLDREAGRLRLAGGETLPYDQLVLATGTRPRALPIPGAELSGVFGLRTLEDADAIRAGLGGARRLAVIGAGFIGLEVAATAAAAGLAVTVLEATGRAMARAVSAPISAFFAALHERAGVRLDFGASASRLVGRDGRVRGVETATGELVEADLVVVGIGVVPNAELAADAGLPSPNGVAVDDHLRTPDPCVSAIGDCALFPSPWSGGAPIRLESVQNAVDGARVVAARLCGRPAPFGPVPWFWSDQGSAKLQIAGLPIPHGETIVRGDPATGAFSVFCFEADRLASVESVSRPADHMAARRILAEGIPLSRAEVADPAFDLRARVAVARPAA